MVLALLESSFASSLLVSVVEVSQISFTDPFPSLSYESPQISGSGADAIELLCSPYLVGDVQFSSTALLSS